MVMSEEQSRKAFEDLAVQAPEREVETLDDSDFEEEDEPKSLADKLDESPDLTDMQSAIARLFPADLGNAIINKVMVARIAPDVFIPLLKMLVNEEIVKSDPTKPISVATIVAKIYTLLSIGLDGKGRIDHIELAGASKETEELEGLGKSLFG